ncbi:MAG: 4'-phosphopantetheinyl transferase superfamily protein [Chlorobium sp.]|nr:MAG: 4'-phosphopantetheinyl transferase superfamily protein [Chlorobium sp.]
MNRNNRHTVSLWTLDLKEIVMLPPQWFELLGDEERLHCLRFRQERDRIAYVAAHALLRCTLSQTLGLPPASLIIARDSMGKPFLHAPESLRLDFNISHTAGMVAVAISKAGKVGVDVEAVDRKMMPQHDVSAFGMSHEEKTELASLSEPERSDAFFDLWTAREAVAKADGRGLSLPFSLIRIDRARNTATIPEHESSSGSNWSLWREQLSSLHRLAVAWPQESGELKRMKPLFCNEQLIFPCNLIET